MGLSENSVPLHPMVTVMIIIPTKWLELGVYHIFRHTQIDVVMMITASWGTTICLMALNLGI